MLTDMVQTQEERDPKKRQARLIARGTTLFEERYSRRYPKLAQLFESDSIKQQTIGATTASVLYNQEEYLDNIKTRYGEATILQNLGDLSTRLLDIVRIFFPNMIASYVADIQPLDSMSSSVLSVKPLYSDTAAGVRAGQEAYRYPTDGTYASDIASLILASGDGSTTTFAATLAPLPIRAGTLSLIQGGRAAATDDGKGLISGPGITGVINYKTGVFSATYTTAPLTGEAMVVEWRYDYERNPDAIRKVEIAINLIPVQAKPHPLMFDYSVAAQLAGSSEWNIDIQDTLAVYAGHFIKKERDYMITSRIAQTALHYSDLDFDTAIPAGTPVTKRVHYQDFSLIVGRAKSRIFEAKQMGTVSFILAGANAAEVIRQQEDFEPEIVTNPIGAYRIGTLEGSIDIIFDPTMVSNDYVFGFRGVQLGDSALILAEWIPLYFTPVFQAPNLRNSQGLLSMYDLLINVPEYWVRGSLLNY